MRYRLLLSFIPFVLAGCHALADHLYGYHPANEVVYPDLQGRWATVDTVCRQLCAFTIINDNGADHTHMFLIFDDGKWANDTSGPFSLVSPGHYVLTDGNTNIDFELKKEELVAYKLAYKHISTNID